MREKSNLETHYKIKAKIMGRKSRTNGLKKAEKCVKKGNWEINAKQLQQILGCKKAEECGKNGWANNANQAQKKGCKKQN